MIYLPFVIINDNLLKYIAVTAQFINENCAYVFDISLIFTLALPTYVVVILNDALCATARFSIPLFRELTLRLMKKNNPVRLTLLQNSELDSLARLADQNSVGTIFHQFYKFPQTNNLLHRNSSKIK